MRSTGPGERSISENSLHDAIRWNIARALATAADRTYRALQATQDALTTVIQVIEPGNDLVSVDKLQLVWHNILSWLAEQPVPLIATEPRHDDRPPAAVCSPEVPPQMPSDTTLNCRDCGQPFVFTVREQEYYASRGFDNPPARCPDCRAARNPVRGNGGRASSSGNRGERELFAVTYTSCGKPAQVPFRPSGDRPVYCSDCYQSHHGSATSGRGRY